MFPTHDGRLFRIGSFSHNVRIRLNYGTKMTMALTEHPPTTQLQKLKLGRSFVLKNGSNVFGESITTLL